MKVDLNTSPVPLAPIGRQISSSAANGETSVQGGAEDRVTLGSSANTVQSLTSQAMSTPAIRQDKVAALQSAIASGSYQVDPAQIASAMAKSEESQG